uniref:Uncharacterized protein n=1 Tax=Glossina palpalis gambiensis TaxID=67801 RepID=A0A1B0APK0_9MUSC
MPLSRGWGFGSHIKVAKHGCESFVEAAITDVFGNKNDGNGGGGIDNIESGGGGPLRPQLPTQLANINTE